MVVFHNVKSDLGGTIMWLWYWLPPDLIFLVDVRNKLCKIWTDTEILYQTGTCHCWQGSALSLYLNSGSQLDNTYFRFRYTDRAHHFTVHAALVTVCMLTVFILFCCAAYEVGRTPEQPASQHVRWCYTESNVFAHGAGHLQQTH